MLCFMPNQAFNSQLTLCNPRQEQSSLRNSSILTPESDYALQTAFASWEVHGQSKFCSYYRTKPRRELPYHKHWDIAQGVGLGQEWCIWHTRAGEPFGLCFHSQLSAQSNLSIQLHLWSNHQFPGLGTRVKLEFHRDLF